MNLISGRKGIAYTTMVLIIGFIVIPAITNPVISDRNEGRGWVYVDDDAPLEWYDATHVRTIQEGIDNASEGDTVFVYNGFYQENVVVNKRIDLVGEDRNHTIIDGGGNGDVVVIHSANWAIFRGFTVQNSGFGPIGEWFAGVRIGTDLNDVHQITIGENDIYDNDIGISIAGFCNENTIEFNYIHHNHGWGIIFFQGSHGHQVIENKVGFNGDSHFMHCGISIGVTDDIFVERNDIYYNKGHGIFIRFGENNRIYGNLIRDNEATGIRIDLDSIGNVLYHNDFFNNSPNAIDNDGVNDWYENYWDDWDGSGPYEIPGEGGNQDPYPLDYPWGWESVSPYDSYMTLSPGGLTTCPAGDETGWGAAYSLPIITATVCNFLGDPIPDIQVGEFHFDLSPTPEAHYYNTLSCTFTPLDNKTDGNGDIRFEVKGDTSIQGNITITAFVRGRELDDTDVLWCNSYDRWLSETLPQDGHVGLQDFAKFAWDWNTARWESDFNWNGLVDLIDFGMFAAHWGHDH